MEVQKDIFTWCGAKAAIAARDLQQTMMSLGRRKMERIFRNGLIQGSPVTTKHLAHVIHINGPDLLGLKVKGNKRNIPSISVDTIKFLPSSTIQYPNISACSDILFANNVAFFGAISLSIRYGYGKRLLNHRIPTFLKSIKYMRIRYDLCGFLLRLINLNSEF